MSLRDKVSARLIARSVVDGDCLLWPNKPRRDGYYTISVNDHMYLLHRVVYWVKDTKFDHISDLPCELHVRHLCKFKNCVNVDHYDAGTRIDNEGDKLIAGTRLSGERSPVAKLTLDRAQQLADTWGTKSVADRARQFNISWATVKAIDERHTWKEVMHPNGKAFVGCDVRNQRQRSTAFENHAALTAEQYDKIRARFLAKTEIVERLYEGSPCREWKKTEKNKVYARFTAYGHTASAHVWACEINQGHPMSQEKPIVRHLCNNTRCVAFDHLKAGTHAENMHDYRLTRKHKILTADEEQRIRTSTKKRKALADEFNVKESLIAKIRRNGIRVRGKQATLSASSGNKGHAR